MPGRRGGRSGRRGRGSVALVASVATASPRGSRGLPSSCNPPVGCSPKPRSRRALGWNEVSERQEKQLATETVQATDHKLLVAGEWRDTGNWDEVKSPYD